MSVLSASLTVVRGTFHVDAELLVVPGITVIVGKSGAGKSTLLSALLGAAKPLAGRIDLGSRTLFDAAAGIDLPVPARRIGIVFQDALLFPHLSARENVAFGLRDGGRPEDWLARVGASLLAHRRPGELSGGERQRVALARALAARPDMLLLDEPFSALDPAARSSLGDLLGDLQRAAGVPFLHVTHDPGEALRLGDSMIAMEGGRVVASGPPADVLSGSTGRIRDLGGDNWLRGIVVEDGPAGSRVDLGGTTVATSRLSRARGEPVVLQLPAEDVLIATGEVRGASARNVLTGTIVSLDETDDAIDVVVATPVRLRARVTPAAVHELALARGLRVKLLVKATAFRAAG